MRVDDYQFQNPAMDIERCFLLLVADVVVAKREIKECDSSRERLALANISLAVDVVVVAVATSGR